MIRYHIRRFRDLHVVLRDLEPHIRNARSLLAGREFFNFPLRPRELFGLWLLSAVANHYGDNLTIANDPEAGDGMLVEQEILDKRDPLDAFMFEQTMVSNFQQGDINECIINAIREKISLGDEYSRNRQLIVFLDKQGLTQTGIIRRYLASQDAFEAYWLIGLSSQNKEDGYRYWVSLLKPIDPFTPPLHEVHISSAFDKWEVTPKIKSTVRT